MSPRRTISVAVFCTAIFAACLSCASAQAQDQKFRVRVPGLAAINASSHFEQIVHDGTDADQLFASQNWQVVCNNHKGAVLTFETNQAFTHTTSPSIKRDVRLVLTKDVPSKWRVTNSADQTNYAGGDEVAIVEADTRKAVDGTFNLTVTFLEELFVDTLAGDYEMTVTGTIVPK